MRAFFAALTVLWGGGILWALKHYFTFKMPSKRLTIAPFSEHTIGRIVHYPQGHFFTVADKDGIYAMNDLCTHRNCILRHKENRLLCPCHGASFDMNGVPVSGPAKKKLDRYYIYMTKDNQLVVDPARIVDSSFRYKES
ncbi:MAG: Rieske (2Fe-2S) protein [Chitinispirillaceae bacterium]|nr:Rieske (2Fe-2S) protein [Chitinispirillaceae bacterium]